MAHPVFKTGRPVQPTGWKVRFLRRSVVANRRNGADHLMDVDHNAVVWSRGDRDWLDVWIDLVPWRVE